MLKKNICRKLKSEKGTSIFFGLLLFMVAAVVSTVILNGAVTAMKRVESDRKAEQNYLTCSSAARMLRDAIENSNIKWQKKVTYNGTEGIPGSPEITWSGTSVNNETEVDKFAAFLKDYIEDFSKNSETMAGKYTKAFAISVPSNLNDRKDDFGEVTATMTIKQSQNVSETANPGFDISVLLTTGSGSDTCQMMLSMPGTASAEQIETTADNKVRTTYITYTWKSADIIYGDKERSVTE